MKALLIEDDIQLNTTIKKFLELQNFDVLSSFDGENAIGCIDDNIFDIYIIDINLPNINGLDIAKYIRQKDLSVPIIMVTASLEVDNFLTAFENGCSDYIKKPFHLKELEVRMSKLLNLKKPNMIKLSENLTYNLDFFEFRFNNELVKLRKKELRLLHILVLNLNRIVTADAIINYVWENEIKEQYPLRQLVSDLKKALPNKDSIKVVVGIGYKLEV